VYKVGENPLGGQTVSVIGAGGRVYYYAHLDSYAPGIEVGDPVNTKTLLGYVGTTGNAQGTPPHLHFGVYTFGRDKSTPVDCRSSNPTAYTDTNQYHQARRPPPDRKSSRLSASLRVIYAVLNPSRVLLQNFT
jgi:murein DD-endopeptidase MepM/ murein hydrolase activator NlpD